MSSPGPLFEGSLIGRERLMQAREYYAPTRTAMPPEAAFAHWTRRIAVQNALGSAREMAGLPDAELDALEAAFIRCPMRPRSVWTRHGLRIGALGIALACILFALGDPSIAGAATGRATAAVGAALLLAGLGGVAVAVLVAFGGTHLDVQHGVAGLYVGRLDEQHPWLYDTLSLLRHEAAESYRQTVLQERGPLRGLDHVMMRELVAAHDALDRLRPASAVADQIQDGPAPIELPTVEPRLVFVGGGFHGPAGGVAERPPATAEAA